MSWEIPLSNLPLQVWPSPNYASGGFPRESTSAAHFPVGDYNPEDQQTQSAILCTQNHLQSLAMWGQVEILVWSRTLSCGACMTHFITVYTQRSFLILQCQLPQLFSVSCLFRYSSFNIFPSFAIYISCTVVLCKHLFIVDAGDGFLPRKGTGLRWLISLYQTIHAVRLFYSLHDLLSPPQCNMQCNLCFMSPALNGSCLTAHADSPIS